MAQIKHNVNSLIQAIDIKWVHGFNGILMY